MTYGHFNFSLFFLLGLSNLYNSKVKGGFMEEAVYNITNKEFNDVNHWVESIYNTVVVAILCKIVQEIDSLVQENDAHLNI